MTATHRNAAVLALGLPLLFAAGTMASEAAAAPQKKNKPERSVALAKSWDSAVAEARMLKLPLVVHSHGFY